MKVTVDQIKMGVAKYIDSEITSKMNGLGKWLVPVAGVAIINNKLDAMILTSSESLKHLGYMSDDHMVDIDRLYSEFKKVAHEKGAITEHFPLIGDVTFTETDIDALKRFIG